MFDTNRTPSTDDGYDPARADVESDVTSLQCCNKSLYASLIVLSLILVAVGVTLGVLSNSSQSSTATSESTPAETNPVQTDQEVDEELTETSGSLPLVAVEDIDADYPVVQWDTFNDSGSAIDAITGEVSPQLSSSPSSDNDSSDVDVPPAIDPAISPVKAPAAFSAVASGAAPATSSATANAGRTTAVATSAKGATAPAADDPTPAIVQSPLQDSLEETLSYSVVDYDWKDATKWEYASGSAVSRTSDMITSGGIRLTSENSAEPIRTIEGWSGEKVVFIEWERTSSSDTNIWMLNTKLQSQFGKGNGWPYWGELDLFEMFSQDAVDVPANDYSGFGGFSAVSSYGQSTLHMGPATENGSPCFCPAQPSKSSWYGNTQPMTSGCTAQFSNDESNSIAAVWSSDATGQFIQIIQKPTITKGGKLAGVDTYDIATGSGGVTSKIYNNAELFWGMDASDACAKAGGHDATNGFPFFESFRIVLEEQKKNDKSASFTVTNIRIFTKN
uniref:Uncharacterized protein n=1 Tax=Hyaloperonospora arabidopsidis (strain Emoy2) TaxID=559515 RepID=M4BC20_HYAAE